MKIVDDDDLLQVCRIAAQLSKRYSVPPDQALDAAVVAVYGTSKRKTRTAEVRRRICRELLKAYAYEAGVTCDQALEKLASHLST